MLKWRRLSWKESVIKVKNVITSKYQKLTVWDKNILWNNVMFTDKSSFYLHYSGMSIWTPKWENCIVVKE